MCVCVCAFWGQKINDIVCLRWTKNRPKEKYDPKTERHNEKPKENEGDKVENLGIQIRVCVCFCSSVVKCNDTIACHKNKTRRDEKQKQRTQENWNSAMDMCRRDKRFTIGRMQTAIKTLQTRLTSDGRRKTQKRNENQWKVKPKLVSTYCESTSGCEYIPEIMIQVPSLAQHECTRRLSCWGVYTLKCKCIKIGILRALNLRTTVSFVVSFYERSVSSRFNDIFLLASTKTHQTRAAPFKYYIVFFTFVCFIVNNKKVNKSW